MRMSYPSSSKWLQRNGGTCEELLALPLGLSERLVSPLSAPRIREDGACVFHPSPCQCSDWLQEIAIAIPTLFPRWGICAPGRSAVRLAPGRVRDHVCVAP